MDKQARLKKLEAVYRRVVEWILDRQLTKSPSEMNVAQSALRELEELTLKVDKYGLIFSRDNMDRLNQLWKQYGEG